MSITKKLNHLQYNTIKRLKNNPDIIILLADKNLGPIIMDRTEYISRGFSDHLSDSKTYKQLTKSNALHQLDNIKDQLQFSFEHPSSHIQNHLSPTTENIL